MEEVRSGVANPLLSSPTMAARAQSGGFFCAQGSNKKRLGKLGLQHIPVEPRTIVKFLNMLMAS